MKSICFCRKGKEEKAWEMQRTQSLWLDIAKVAQTSILIIDDLDHMLLICGIMLSISTGKSGLKRARFRRSGLTCGCWHSDETTWHCAACLCGPHSTFLDVEHRDMSESCLAAFSASTFDLLLSSSCYISSAFSYLSPASPSSFG